MSKITSTNFKDVDGEKLFHEVESLSHISKELQRLGFIASTLSYLNITVLIFIVFFLRYLNLDPAITIFAFSVIPCMLTIVLIGIYDQFKRRGDALFEEISDELQWHITQRFTKPEKNNKQGETTNKNSSSPDLQLRITLRTFARSIQLPLTPGHLGPVIYVAINLLIVVFSTLYYLLPFGRF